MPSNIFLPIDGDCRPTIDKAHHECHEGNFYTFHYENLTAASGATNYIHIKTGSKYTHITFDWQAIVGNMFIKIYEDPTLGTAGTVININARNRVNINTPTTTVFLNPTVSTVGTLIGTRTMLNSSTTQSKATAVRNGIERILKSNEDYLVAITNGAASMAYTVDGSFYEED